MENWSHGAQTAVQAMNGTKLEPWTSIASLGIPVVIFGLLKIYKICARPLEAHILEQKRWSFSPDLFMSGLANPYDDPDFKNIMSSV